ncbi:hypothetical protein AV521_31085 [Streptomyces sp. IMTB 2501]|nr:hypothetical protein AV521_31085 [Streptomyces sp. IMTB 2501]
MNADTVNATCAVVIDVASLIVSVCQRHAMRQPNRHSARPILNHTRTGRRPTPDALNGLLRVMPVIILLELVRRRVGAWLSHAGGVTGSERLQRRC